MRSLSELDGILLINLPRRTDRLAASTAELKRVGLWDETITIPGDDKSLPPKGWNRGKGGYRCLRSHMSALESAIKCGWERFMVLEDDVVFHPQFEEYAEEFLRELPRDWDAIYLGPAFRPWSKNRDHRPRRLQVSDKVVRIKGARASQARIWTKACAKALLREMQKRTESPPWRRNDRISALFQFDDRWNFYAPDRSLAWQRVDKSDTQLRVMNHSAFIWESRMFDNEITTAAANAAQEIEGWSGLQELRWLAGAASRCKRVVEIGSFKGRTAVAMAKAMELYSKGEPWQLVCVDTFMGTPIWRRQRRGTKARMAWEETQSKGSYLETFLRNVERMGGGRGVTPVVSRSADCVVLVEEVLVGKKADMVFIDGDHSEEAVVQDIEVALKLLRPGGLICGHDCVPKRPGLERGVSRGLGEYERGPESIWYKVLPDPDPHSTRKETKR